MPLTSLPDAEAQCAALAELIRPQLQPDTMLVGIHSGGVWVARRLAQLLGLPEQIGLIDVSFYRDDFGEKGLHPQVKPTSIPFDVEGRPLWALDTEHPDDQRSNNPFRLLIDKYAGEVGPERDVFEMAQPLHRNWLDGDSVSGVFLIKDGRD